MKKKMLAVLLAGAMVASLTACGGSNSADTADGGDSVLVDHLLPPIAVEHHGKGVESGDDPPQLVPVHQEHGHIQSVLTHVGQINVL